jgi:hypothetical protein
MMLVPANLWDVVPHRARPIERMLSPGKICLLKLTHFDVHACTLNVHVGVRRDHFGKAELWPPAVCHVPNA